MKVLFLRSADRSLVWFNAYYNRVFPEGRANARKSMSMMKRTLSAFPLCGRLDESGEVRIYQISNTPFAAIYRVLDDHVAILALHDQRSGHFPDI